MDSLAYACEEVARWNSRLKKIAILGDYLRTLEDADLARAVRFLCCGPVFEGSDAKISAGSATIRQALVAATGWDDFITGICYRETGDSGETVARLVEGHTQNEPLSLADAERIYARLFKARKTADKVEIFRECFQRYRPGALKYLIKVITGNLRIGLLSRTLEEAIAVATGVPHDAIRTANNRKGDLAAIALAARHSRLHAIEARLFHPMEFMLAKPLEDVRSLDGVEQWLVEDKYDGIRAQIHFHGGRVAIYSRGMEEITRAFPEVVETFAVLGGSGVIDGEILAWKDGRALAFTVLQQRIARKKTPQELRESVPIAVMAYDVMYARGKMLDEETIEVRREELEQLLAGSTERIMLAPQSAAATHDEIDRHFDDARARGNEGLILKRKGSLYEAGRRSGTWLKVKRPYGTLDVVITAAEQGHGRRATVLSDYTFAVRAGEEFVNVGKAYSGLTDAEVRELTRVLRSLGSERFGRVLLVKPEVVLEVAFDGVQSSPRHKGGYALRFPRILRWRRDKTAAESDTIDTVRELYEASLRR